MEFPISGVEVSPIVPLVTGFVIASVTTPAGVSGAFLLLPFQFSVLGFTAPGVTPTNLLYNVISTPGSIVSYRSLDAIDRKLVGQIVTGATPGIALGAILRITLFEHPGDFKVFVGLVLLGLGTNLVVGSVVSRGSEEPVVRGPAWAITLLGAGAGIIGGIYGISGGSIVAPVLVAVFGLPVRRVAPAALVATFLTSLAGVLTFEVLEMLAETGDPARRPDWLLALLFGMGGAAGGVVGARLNVRMPEGALRALLGTLAAILGVSYVASAL